MIPKYENHRGKCGHCATAVPIEAAVCAGCGAEWGFKDGSNRPEAYKNHRFMKNLSFIVTFIGVALAVTGYVLGEEVRGNHWWDILCYVLALVPIIMGPVMLLDAMVGMRSAKKKKLSWWRRRK